MQFGGMQPSQMMALQQHTMNQMQQHQVPLQQQQQQQWGGPFSPPAPPAAVPVAPPADMELKNVIERIADYVTKNGPQFVDVVREKHPNDPKFAFLSGGEGHDYFRFCLSAAQQQQQPRPNDADEHVLRGHAATGERQRPSSSPPCRRAPHSPSDITAHPDERQWRSAATTTTAATKWAAGGRGRRHGIAPYAVSGASEGTAASP